MASEIERKFLITNDEWKQFTPLKTLILEQGYTPFSDQSECRLYIYFNETVSLTYIHGQKTYHFEALKGIISGDFEGVKALPTYDQKKSCLKIDDTTEARIRIVEDVDTGEKTAIFAVKYNDFTKPESPQRLEFELYISVEDAQAVFQDYISDTVKKKRYVVAYEGREWEIDSYLEHNKGLVTADIEVEDEAVFATLKMLPGATLDVTGEKTLNNKKLASHAAPSKFKYGV